MVAGGALSIGALSAATGIPAETIRTWERRYGFPVAERKPSGHRVYPVSTVPRLRLISQALARGHRAAEVVSASEDELEALLAALPQPANLDLQRTVAPTSGSHHDPTELFDAVRAFDRDGLRRAFQREWAQLGPLEFVEQRAAPFMNAVGAAWAAGELDVRHEHFASACLGDFLRTVRIPLDDRADGPLVVLATLPGERHGLGLQMSALVFALMGWRALILGVETPIDQIVALVRETPVAAVAISSVYQGADDDVALLRTLRRRLPRSVALLVGGAAVPSDFAGSGIAVMKDLPALDQWLRAHRN